MKKIKWRNVGKLFVFIISTITVLHDLYMVTVYTTLTGKLMGWTYFGFITFCIALYFAYTIYEDFKNQIKKSGDITHTTATQVNN